MDTYQVLELIGRGSFGEIRKVRRIHDGAILCRKEILWRKMKPRERQQLQAEMRILASLQHKHIVQYIEQVTDQASKMVYIYMEYCGNGDLHELITARKEQNPSAKFAEAMVWQVFSQLCLALYRCHNGVDAPPVDDLASTGSGEMQAPVQRIQNSILHRDIKPQNIFLDHDNRVKLGDFGLSKEVTGPGLAETYVGTPFYMSPEIIAGRSYNAKSDIWAMGCCIYELCAFEPPFLARDQQELNLKIKAGQITSVTRFGYSESLDRAIRACLSQSETRRPSAATLLRMQEMHFARRLAGVTEQEALLRHRTEQLESSARAIETTLAQRSQLLDQREAAQQVQLEQLAAENARLRRELERLKPAEQHQITDPMPRPSLLQRTQSAAPALGTRLDDPLNLYPRDAIPLPTVQCRRPLSPRRKPLTATRLRAEPAITATVASRPPLVDQINMQASLAPSLYREHSEEQFEPPYNENAPPTTSSAPVTPQKGLSRMTLAGATSPSPSSNRMLASPAKRRLSAFPSPMSTTSHSSSSLRTRTLLTAQPRTLFLQDDRDTLSSVSERRRALQREDQRIAPPAPVRQAGTTLQRQVTTRAAQHQQFLQTQTRTAAAARATGDGRERTGLLGSPAVYDVDDLPSPFLKKTYSLKALGA